MIEVPFTKYSFFCVSRCQCIRSCITVFATGVTILREWSLTLHGCHTIPPPDTDQYTTPLHQNTQHKPQPTANKNANLNMPHRHHNVNYKSSLQTHLTPRYNNKGYNAPQNISVAGGGSASRIHNTKQQHHYWRHAHNSSPSLRQPHYSSPSLPPGDSSHSTGIYATRTLFTTLLSILSYSCLVTAYSILILLIPLLYKSARKKTLLKIFVGYRSVIVFFVIDEERS